MIKDASIALDIISMLFLILSFIISLWKIKNTHPLFKSITKMVVFVLLMLLSDALYVIFSNTSNPTNNIICFLAKNLFFFCNSAVVLLWVNYVGRLIWAKKLNFKSYRKIYLIIAITNHALVATNLFFPILFRIDDAGQFVVSTLGMTLFTFLNYVSIIIMTTSLIHNRHKLINGAFYVLIGVEIFALAGEILAFKFREISFISLYALASILLLNVFERYTEYSNIDRIIDDAIDKKKFEVYFQPVFSIKDNKFLSCEALLRLRDDNNKFIPPDIIINAAEASNKTVNIGRIIFRKVCEFMTSDKYKELHLNHINVNFSMSEITKPGMAYRLLDIINSYGINPSEICIEITETVVGDQLSLAMDNMTTLSKSGILFALDDYGSGYSNLYRISALPFSQIKLDKTIVQDINDKKLKAIVENTLRMTKELNFETVIEGVETEEQLNRFRMLGVDYIQGYYYSKPLAKEDFVDFININNN